MDGCHGRNHIMPRRPKRNCEDNPLEKGTHAPDLRQLARSAIKDFLQDKERHSGGNISQTELYSDDSIKTVLRTQFDDATFEYIHENCLSRIPPSKKYRDATVPWPVHVLLGLLTELKYLQIPKELQPGLLLLYFKFCKGFDIPPPPLL